MGTISDKLTYLNVTKGKLKDSINKYRNGITNQTTFRNYATELDGIYDLLPKVDNTSDASQLLNAQNGLLDEFKMYGNSKQGKLPDGYTQVDYIESSGTQYIDTNFKPNQDTSVEFKGIITQTESSKGFYGARTDTSSSDSYVLLASRYFNNNKSYQFNYGGGGGILDLNVPYTNINKYLGNKNELYINDNLQITRETTTFSTPYNLYLMAVNTANTPTLYAYERLYYFKIYDNDKLVRDFIPCYRNSDNEVGLYDLVNDTFYTNQGTGAFTYGSVAPTPDAPIDIDVVIGTQTINVSGKNLFDKDNANVFAGYINGSNLTINTDDTNRCLYIECKPNTTYTIQKSIISENKFRVGTSNTVPTTSRTLEDANIADASSSITLTTSANAHYLIVHFYNTASENTIEQALATIQIEKGNLATDWEPYREINYTINLGSMELCEINTYEDMIAKSTGKNLIGLGTQLNGYRATANGNFQETQTAIGYYFETSKLPDKITISSTNGNRSNVSYYNSVPYQGLNTTEYSNSNDVPRTINVDKTYTYIHIQFSYNVGDVYNIQIEEGSQATDYEPFGKVWYKKASIGKVILNGSEEDWSTTGSTYTLNNYINAKVLSSVATEQGAISDYFKWGNGNTSTYVYGSFWYASGKNLRFQKDETLNLSNFKTWLSTNNLTVYYILATPTTTEITETELINQLEAISVFTGTNNFTISNLNNVLPTIYAKRLKELDKLN